jgi:hypothetical protein
LSNSPGETGKEHCQDDNEQDFHRYVLRAYGNLDGLLVKPRGKRLVDHFAGAGYLLPAHKADYTPMRG